MPDVDSAMALAPAGASEETGGHVDGHDDERKDLVAVLSRMVRRVTALGLLLGTVVAAGAGVRWL